MNKHSQPMPKSYKEASALLTSDKPLKIANNTYLEWGTEETEGEVYDVVIVRLHATDIVTFFEDGTTELNTDGFQTQTTCERINRFIPESIYVALRNGKFQVFNKQTHLLESNFVDGMTINSVTGEVH